MYIASAGLSMAESVDYQPLAPAHFPEVLFLIIEMQQPVPRIVALAAVGAGNEAADVHPLAIVVFGDGKGAPTTAGYEEMR